jgi:hypothetical protein
MRRLMKLHSAVTPWLVILCLVVTASCGSAEREVRGTVTVDGAPLETGTIHFQPNQNGEVEGSGAAVNGGQFKLAENLLPGSYKVAVEGFKKTGRVVNDPQRGKVEETTQLAFQQMPMQVEVTAENSENMQIDLKTAR